MWCLLLKELIWYYIKEIFLIASRFMFLHLLLYIDHADCTLCFFKLINKWVLVKIFFINPDFKLKYSLLINRLRKIVIWFICINLEQIKVFLIICILNKIELTNKIYLLNCDYRLWNPIIQIGSILNLSNLSN